MRASHGSVYGNRHGRVGYSLGGPDFWPVRKRASPLEAAGPNPFRAAIADIDRFSFHREAEVIVRGTLGIRLNDIEISKAPQKAMSNADRTQGSSYSEGGCAVDQNEFSRLAELTAAQREELLDQLDKVSAARPTTTNGSRLMLTHAASVARSGTSDVRDAICGSARFMSRQVSSASRVGIATTWCIWTSGGSASWSVGRDNKRIGLLLEAGPVTPR